MSPLIPLALLGVSSSQFWQDADAMCPHVAAMQALDPIQLGQAAPIRDELLAYCTSRRMPRFAARPIAERAAALQQVRQALGITSSPQPALPFVAIEALSPEHAASLVDVQDPLGTTGRAIAKQILQKICEGGAVAADLPAICGAASQGAVPSMSQLKVAVVRDLLLLSQRSLDGATASEQAKQARVWLATFRAASGSADLRAWGPHLDYLASQPGACDGVQNAACDPFGTNVRIGAAILSRVLLDGPVLDRPDEHYSNIVEEVLRVELQRPNYELTPALRSRVPLLIASLRQINALRAKVEKTAVADADRARLRLDILVQSVRSFEQAVACVASARGAGAPIDLSLIISSVQALEVGDTAVLWKGVSPLFDSMVQAGILTKTAADGVSVAVRLSALRSQSDLEVLAKEYLLPFGIWTGPWVVDVNGDIPKLESGNSNINGDLTLGYNAGAWGIVGRGSFLTYDFRFDNGFSQTDRWDGNLEGWWMTGLSRDIRFELRATAGASLYDSSQSDRANDKFFGDESSLIGRGSLLVGIRYHPDSRFAIAFLAGGGGQYEFHDALGNVQGSTIQYAGKDEETFGGRGEGRFRMQWDAVPDVLAFRLRADISAFQLSRDTWGYTTGTSSGTLTQSSTQKLSQIEMFGRAFVDIEALRFFEFMPSIHAGVNLLRQSGDLGSASTTIPVFGAGIRREAF